MKLECDVCGRHVGTIADENVLKRGTVTCQPHEKPFVRGGHVFRDWRVINRGPAFLVGGHQTVFEIFPEP